MSGIANGGNFPWYTLYSSAPEKAARFYEQLLGWERCPSASPMQVIFTRGARSICEMTFLPSENKQKSHWLSSIGVQNLDLTLKLAEYWGGWIVKPPFEIPGLGRTAVVADPFGALFMPLATREPRCQSAMADFPGGLCWNELTVSSPPAAAEFYGKVLGWQFTRSSLDTTVFEFSSGGHAMGSVRRISPVSGLAPATWMVYFATSNLEKSLRLTDSLGGKHLTGGVTVPGRGRFALIEDPSAALCYLFQKSEDVAKEPAP